MNLIFANVNEDDVLLRGELDEMVKKYPNFTVYYVLNNVCPFLYKFKYFNIFRLLFDLASGCTNEYCSHQRDGREELDLWVLIWLNKTFLVLLAVSI